MTQRLLFVPDYRISRAASERLPALKTALEMLQAEFDVSLFRWPTTDSDVAPRLTFGAVIDAMREALSPRSHLVLTGGNGFFGLLAASGYEEGLRSFITDGVCVPVATLRALELNSLADAAAASYRLDVLRYQAPRAFLQDLEEVRANELAAAMCADAQWSKVEDLLRDYGDLNLLTAPPSLSVPVLYLAPPTGFAGWVEVAEAFMRFVPQASVAQLDLWPRYMHSSAAGVEFAQHVSRFIKGLPAPSPTTEMPS